MATSGIKWESDQMRRRLTEIAAAFPGRVVGAAYREGERIMTESKEHHVPVDLGDLRNSGHVQKPRREGHTIVIDLAYGGEAAAYALAVHETPSKHDPPSWVGKRVRFSPAGHGAKYLERPLMAAVPGMAKRIAEDLEFDDL